MLARSVISDVMDRIAIVSTETGSEMANEIPEVVVDSFEAELTQLLNRHSLDAATDIPDHLLARLVIVHIDNFRTPVITDGGSND